MTLTKINLREKEFHNKLQSKKGGRFEAIFYKAIYNAKEDFLNFLSENSINSEILDFGCGDGYYIEKVIKFNPKKITGIDISEVAINDANKNAKDLGLNVEYKVDNCEKTSFENNSFDIVYGTGILHHLQIDKCLDEINRVLKSNGNLLFIEPLGTNPLINLYRKFTPKSRSIDEHPLLNKDFKYINKKFTNVKIKYYGFLTLIFFPFYKSPGNSKLFKVLTFLDQFLFKFKFFQYFAWSVLIRAKKI
jgi:ubiquinone/menaquinone biosynthesis C-methylase UbiE